MNPIAAMVKAGRLTELGVSATRARLCGFPNDKGLNT